MARLKDDLRLALDCVAFAKEIGKKLRRPITPDDWQADLLKGGPRDVLLNCSRQSGKSTICAILTLHKALFEPESLILVVAPAERQSKEFFAKVSRFYLAYGGCVTAESVRRMGLELANGSRIEALPGSEKTIRSFSDVSLLILDEAARVDDELYYAVSPMLAVSGGSLMMLSTPYGKRGVFYREWTEGEGWERFEVPAPMCPRITREFLAKEAKRLPERVFLQEYFCKFMEAEDQVFSDEVIEAAFVDEVGPLWEDESQEEKHPESLVESLWEEFG